MRFNPPPNWPQPPKGWQPPEGWQPDASWPPPPPGWQLWIDDDPAASEPRDVPRPANAARAKTRRWWRKWFIVVPAVVALVAVAVVVAFLVTGDDGPPKNPDAVRLGFSGLTSAYRIAVDSDGVVYVIDSPIGGPDRVLKLDANSSSQQELLESKPNEGGFSGLATDNEGNLYVVQTATDFNATDQKVATTGRLWRIDTATSEATSLPFSGEGPIDVAIGPDGELFIQYAANKGIGPRNQTCEISRMSSPSSSESVLAEVNGCYAAFGGSGGGFAVDSAANMYFVVQKDQEESDYQWYVLKIAPDGQQTALPDVGDSLAVDANGTLYGVGSGDIRVLKPGSTEPEKILGVGWMPGIAVGPDGVYVTDSDNVFRIPMPE